MTRTTETRTVDPLIDEADLLVRGVLMAGDRTVASADIQLPQPGPSDAVVRVTMSAVCGSDLPHYRKRLADLGTRAQTVPGHEAVGVVEVSAADGSGLPHGARVIVYQHSGEGKCDHCRRGEPMFCRCRQTLGNHRHGADAQKIVAPASSLIPIPDELDDALAALLSCNFGTAFMGFRKTGAGVRDLVAVVGLGPVGACVVAAAAAAGANVVAIDPIPGRRRLAEDLGAHTVIDPTSDDPVSAVRSISRGEGADVVIECSANPRAQGQAMKCVRVHGTVLLLGANNAMEIDPGIDVIRKEMELLGSWVFKRYEADTVIRAALSMPSLRRIISEPFPCEQSAAAFAAADSGRTGKTLIDWS